MADIKIPATPRSAYDPSRSANVLLLTHVRELEKALLDAGRRVRRKKPTTETQVAAYIRHLHRALHQQILLPPMKRRPLDVPLDGQSPRPSPVKSRTAARTRAAASPPRKNASRLRKRKRRRHT